MFHNNKYVSETCEGYIVNIADCENALNDPDRVGGRINGQADLSQTVMAWKCRQ
jgi:hypothetical protein